MLSPRGADLHLLCGVSDKDCGRVFALLSEYLDEERMPASCEELEEHLRGCPECIQFVRRLQLCHRFGNRMPAPKVDVEAMGALRQAYEKMLARRRGSRADSQG